MTQRHVVPADIAEQMFPTYVISSMDGKYHQLPTVRWLVGPIDCETCDGSGNAQVYGRNSPPCQDCDGLGYPPTIEIVSERLVWTRGQPFTAHGVVKLGKPVPIVGMSQANADDYTEDVFILAPVGNGTRPVRVDRTAGVEYVMSNIGPCSPGQVAYPIEVVS